MIKLKREFDIKWPQQTKVYPSFLLERVWEVNEVIKTVCDLKSRVNDVNIRTLKIYLPGILEVYYIACHKIKERNIAKK